MLAEASQGHPADTNWFMIPEHSGYKYRIMKKYYSLLMLALLGVFADTVAQTTTTLNYDFDKSGTIDDNYDNIKLFFRYGNPQEVISVKISPDSKTLATLDKGGNIAVWDVNSRRQVMAVNGARDQITTIAFTPDGKYLLGTGSPRMFKKDKNYYLNYWEPRTGKLVYRKTLNISIKKMYVSPDGTKLYTMGSPSKFSAKGLTGNYIQVRDITNGNLLKELPLGLTSGDVFAVSPWGDRIVFGNRSAAAKATKIIKGAFEGNYDRMGYIQIRDAESGKNLDEFYVGKHGLHPFLQGVLFLSKDNILLIGNFENSNFIKYNISTGSQFVVNSGSLLDITSVEISGDGRFIYITTPHELIKVNSSDFSVVKRFQVNDIIKTMAFGKNGKIFITGGVSRQTGANKIRVWDYKTDKQLDRFESKVAKIVSTVFVAGRNDLVIGTDDGQAQILNLTSGKLSATLNAGSGSVDVKITTNGRYLVTAATGKAGQGTFFKHSGPVMIKIWDVNTYELIDSIPDFNEFIISPDDKYVFVMKDGRMKVFEFKTGKVIKEKNIIGSFIPVSFSNDGTKILTQASGTFKIRDAKTLKKITSGKKYSGIKGQLTSVMYNAGESKIIGTVAGIKDYKGALIEWNTDGSVSRVLYENDSAEVWNVVLKPGSDILLCGIKNKDETGDVAVIDLKTGKIIKSISGIGFPLQYTPDGKHIIAFSDNYRMGVSILDAGDFKREISYLKVNRKDGYVIYTDDYYYSMTKNARDAVSFVKSGEVYPFEQFDLQFNRPDIIAGRMPYPDENLIKIYKAAYDKRLSKMGISEDKLKLNFDLPEVVIVNGDKLPLASESKNITLKIEARGKSATLQNLKIWVNDVPVYGSKGKDISGRKSKVYKNDINLELSEGKNKIQVAVLDAGGVESLKKTQYIEYTGPKTKHDIYIVAIGVSHYADSKYNLTYAAKDVTDFVNFMQSQKDGFNAIHVYKFIDTDAVSAKVMKVKTELMKSKVDDEVVVYFAGHGLLNSNLDYFLGMYDVNFEKPEINGLSIDDFENLVDGIPSRKKSMFLDACHSGEVDKEEALGIKETVAGGDEGIVFRGVAVPSGANVVRSNSDLSNSFELMKETFADLRRGSGAMVISSAGGGEFALESDKWKNGVFTLSVIQGLTGNNADVNGDNQVTISELGAYVAANVRKLTSGQQNPTFRRENLEYDYVFLNPGVVIINKGDADEAEEIFNDMIKTVTGEDNAAQKVKDAAKEEVRKQLKAAKEEEKKKLKKKLGSKLKSFVPR
jgi:WD40 repeat protein